jgi:hypothetical protein
MGVDGGVVVCGGVLFDITYAMKGCAGGVVSMSMDVTVCISGL